MRSYLSFSMALAAAALLFTLATTHPAHAQSDGGSGGGASFNCDLTPCGGDSTVWPWSYPPPFIVPCQIDGCQYTVPQTCCTLTCKYRVRQPCFPKTYQLELLSFSWDRECENGYFDPVPMLRTIVY